MTTEEYWKQVDAIELRNPIEPLLATLQSGPSRLNEIYLKSALTRLPEEEAEEDDTEKLDPANADETLRGLWRLRTQLFGKMNKQSNVFHECNTDEQRAENSRKVLGIWAEILAVKANIAYYEINGELPEPVDTSDELPENPVELSRKLNSLRARISQKKTQLAVLAGLDAGTPDKQAKIDAGEADLKKLRHQLGLAVEKLKAYETA